MNRTVCNDHPFFDECLQFYLLNLATFAVGLHLEAQKDVFKLEKIVNTLYSALKHDGKVDVEVEGEMDVADFPPFICWQDSNSNEDCFLHVSKELVDYIRNGTVRPQSLSFTIRPSSKNVNASGEIEFPKPDIGYVAVDGFIPTILFETVIAYLVGGSYERFKTVFNFKYGASTANWPTELQFFRHLRNGCFHKNQFNITPRTRSVDGVKTKVDQIDSLNPPKWHHYVMESDAVLNGTKVIGQSAFFNTTHLLLMLDDMNQFTEMPLATG